MDDARRAIFRQDEIAARAHRGAQGGARIDLPPTRIEPEAPGADSVLGQAQFGDRPFGARDLGGAHLGEVLVAKDFLPGNSERGVDVELGLFLFGDVLVLTLEERVGSALLAGPLLPFLLARWRLGREHGDHFLDEFARAPEQAESLIEDERVFVARDEIGVERPVEILARGEPRHLHRLDRLKGRGRTDLQPRPAKGPCEPGDVVGEAATRIGLERRLNLYSVRLLAHRSGLRTPRGRAAPRRGSCGFRRPADAGCRPDI